MYTSNYNHAPHIVSLSSYTHYNYLDVPRSQESWVAQYQSGEATSQPVESSILESGALAAFEKSGSEWNYSKMMIVGEGRAGKTAFSRSIIGDKFMETDSTVGISQFSCLINQMSASGSGSLWSKSTGRAKEYESAIARNMKQAKDNVASKEEKSILDSSSFVPHCIWRLCIMFQHGVVDSER